MIKSVIVSFDEADESFITALFKRMRLKVKPFAPPAVGRERGETKAEKIQGLRDAIQEVNAARRGEIKLQSAEDFLAELKEEEVDESKQLETV